MSWESDHILLRGVCIVGEYTTDNGPYDEDYFLVVVTATDRWFEWPITSDEAEHFRSRFESEVAPLAETRLITSTDYKSNILWPPELAGTTLFVFQQVPAKSPIDWCKKLIGVGRIGITLSDSAKAKIDID